MAKLQRAVFSDLDGVLFQLVDHLGEFGVSARSIDEVALTTSLAGELDSLKTKGFLVIGVTNQPDIARGKITAKFLAEKHSMLLQQYPQIAKIFCCEHTETNLCDCRKPKPGLLINAAREFNLDLSRSWVIGDSRADIEAGLLVHARTVFVQTKYNVGDPAVSKATAVTRSPQKAFRLISDVERIEAGKSMAN